MLLFVTELVPIAGNGVPGVWRTELLGSSVPAKPGRAKGASASRGRCCPIDALSASNPDFWLQPWAGSGGGGDRVPESRRLPRGPQRPRDSTCPWRRRVTHLWFPRAPCSG